MSFWKGGWYLHQPILKSLTTEHRIRIELLPLGSSEPRTFCKVNP